MVGAVDITFPPELPVSQRRDDIAAAIRDHQVVVAGDSEHLPAQLTLPMGHVLALGPARGGSKGIPDKNIRPLGCQ